MMLLCLDLFYRIIVQRPGLLPKILLEHFAASKFLYDDIMKNNLEEDFKNYIYSFADDEKENFNTSKDSLNKVYDIIILGYVKANDGKYYKYNCYTGSVRYCSNNVIIDHFEVKKYPEERYLVLDYFIIDLELKKLKLYDSSIRDSFVDRFENIFDIKILNSSGENEKVVLIKTSNDEDIYIYFDDLNRITGYDDKTLKKVGDDFLYRNIGLEEVDFPKLIKAKMGFMSCDENLKIFDAPNLESCGICFLHPFCEDLEVFNAPKLDGHMWLNSDLQKMLDYNKCKELKIVKSIKNLFSGRSRKRKL